MNTLHDEAAHPVGTQADLVLIHMAPALGISGASVRSRFFRARGIQREGLSRDIDLAIGDAFFFAGPRCDHIVESMLAKIAHKRGTPPS